MRTAHFNGRFGGWGVSLGVCVCPGGCLPGGWCISSHYMMEYTASLRTEWQTGIKHYLPATSIAGGKYALSIYIFRNAAQVVFRSSGKAATRTGFYIQYHALAGNLFCIINSVCINMFENKPRILFCNLLNLKFNGTSAINYNQWRIKDFPVVESPTLGGRGAPTYDYA